MHCDPRQLLRDHALRLTPQRLAVLAAVHRLPHSTADVIADAVRSDIGAISRQSVYDTLATLTEKGLVRRVEPAGSPALYDPRTGDNHHHAICRVCGAVVDVDCSIATAPCLDGTASGFQIDEAEVTYWGTCPTCLERRSKRPATRTRVPAKPGTTRPPSHLKSNKQRKDHA
ncbi:MAG: Fur family transcriptional regulator [Planctomycetota bacterium]